MAWILRRFTFTLKMALALVCILCLGFTLSVPSTENLVFETNSTAQLPASEQLPVFYLGFQPYALSEAYSALPAGPYKHQLGKLILRYGQEKDWIDWFKAARRSAELPSPDILDQLFEEPELAPNLPCLPVKLKRLKVRSLPWYEYLPRPAFYPCNEFQVWLFGRTAKQQGLLHGNLGFSRSNRWPVLDLVLKAAGTTLRFSVPALILGFILSLFLALFATLHGWPSTPFLLLSIVPSFLMGALVFIMFDWGGATTPSAATSLHLISFLLAYKLPLITLSSINMAIFAAHNQVWIQTETQRLFFQTALAKGLTSFQALSIHALRAALPLILTFLLQRLPLLISGTVVVEVMFGVPGFGRLAWMAVLEKDQPLVLGCLLFAALIAWVAVYLNTLLAKYSKSVQ